MRVTSLFFVSLPLRCSHVFNESKVPHVSQFINVDQRQLFQSLFEAQNPEKIEIPLSHFNCLRF